MCLSRGYCKLQSRGICNMTRVGITGVLSALFERPRFSVVFPYWMSVNRKDFLYAFTVLVVGKYWGWQINVWGNTMHIMFNFYLFLYLSLWVCVCACACMRVCASEYESLNVFAYKRTTVCTNKQVIACAFEQRSMHACLYAHICYHVCMCVSVGTSKALRGNPVFHINMTEPSNQRTTEARPRNDLRKRGLLDSVFRGRRFREGNCYWLSTVEKKVNRNIETKGKVTFIYIRSEKRAGEREGGRNRRGREEEERG